MNTIDNITIERLDTIERERTETLMTEEFQQWCKDMSIGVRVEKREGINRANDMMAQWSGSMSEGEKMWPDWIRRMY
jgi:hypothetical protein